MNAVNNPTTPVRAGEALDWEALAAHLRTVIPGLSGMPQVSQFSGGNSNLTYLLEYPGADLVLRRPPFGTKARTAHSMAREYRILNAIRPYYPAVPETLYYTEDESIIGSEFYVMRKVEGQVIKEQIPAEWGFSAADNSRFCERAWEKLVELHQVDYQAAGLADFGRPEGYAGRQISGWNRRYERVITEDADAFEDVRRWLEDHVPNDPGRFAILHGDFRIDNLVLDNNDPCRVRAVLDWEICALGDPLMDLGNALAYWVEPGDPPAMLGLAMQPSTAPGMMTRQEILAFYQQRTGLDTTAFNFYRVYGYWRMAVILQQIYFRYFHGQTQDPRFKAFGPATRQLGEFCRRLVAG